MFLFEWQSETIDDGPKDLEQLSNAIESLSFVNELEKDVVDGTSNVRTQVQELAVNAMQCSFEKVSLPGVLGVKKFKKLLAISQRL